MPEGCGVRGSLRGIIGRYDDRGHVGLDRVAYLLDGFDASFAVVEVKVRDDDVGNLVKRPDAVAGVRGRLRYGYVAPPLLKQIGQPLGTGEIVFNQKDLRTFHASKGRFREGRCSTRRG